VHSPPVGRHAFDDIYSNSVDLRKLSRFNNNIQQLINNHGLLSITAVAGLICCQTMKHLALNNDTNTKHTAKPLSGLTNSGPSRKI